MSKPPIGRQAIVVIHGIGEQRPMDTLRGFVQAFLKTGSTGSAVPKFFNKPDFLSNLPFELRTLCVYVPAPADPNEKLRLDFFEYYWANQMGGTKYGHVLSWLRRLLIRKSSNVPRRIRWLHKSFWRSFWVALILLAFTLIYWNSKSGLDDTNVIFPSNSGIVTTVVSLVLTIVGNILGYFSLRYLGDAARYTDASPENIEDRQKIRANGVKLLKAIHASGNYDRVVVIGHSLGSIIGYDILKNLWTAYNTVCPGPNFPSQTNLKTFETKYANQTVSITNGKKFRDEQADLSGETRMSGNPWIVTDFITIGSPLAYASILLANNRLELKNRQHERELPTCPPYAEDTTSPFSYQIINGPATSPFFLHHGALYACTRWHNGYFINDFVGGPLRHVFGSGINDMAFKIPGLTGRIPFASHTKYWQNIVGYNKSLQWLCDIILPPNSPGNTGIIKGV